MCWLPNEKITIKNTLALYCLNILAAMRYSFSSFPYIKFNASGVVVPGFLAPCCCPYHQPPLYSGNDRVWTSLFIVRGGSKRPPVGGLEMRYLLRVEHSTNPSGKLRHLECRDCEAHTTERHEVCGHQARKYIPRSYRGYEAHARVVRPRSKTARNMYVWTPSQETKTDKLRPRPAPVRVRCQLELDGVTEKVIIPEGTSVLEAAKMVSKSLPLLRGVEEQARWLPIAALLV